MQAAMIDINTNTVIGIIMADAEIDPAPKSTYLINLPDDSRVTFDWVYDLTTQQFTAPTVGV
jgi:hypothetical protein